MNRIMTNKETIDRWAEQIIPAVFKAEDALQKAKPEWKEKLKNVNGENGALLARLYCEEIATIIVTQAEDYEPDGTTESEAVGNLRTKVLRTGRRRNEG